MASEGKSHLEKISSGFKNVQGLLRGRNLPGTVRVSRREPDLASSIPDNSHQQEALHEPEFATNGGREESSPNPELVMEGIVAAEPISKSGRHSADQSSHAEQGSRGPSAGMNATASSSIAYDSSSSRSNSSIVYRKFQRVLEMDMINVEELRDLAWSGIPPTLRPTCWRLLLGYTPPNRERRDSVLARKRGEYRKMVPEFYDIANNERSEEEVGALRQVAVDVPRTAPGVAFFQHPAVQKSLERILYLWGIRHPASGYVQGINDLVTPFLAIFTSEHFASGFAKWEEWDLDSLEEDVVLDIEADCYWCLCKLLDGIQDHYTSAQPGIQRTVFKVKELVSQINDKLTFHLENQGVDFLQFAFRWVNCLLLREFPFQLIPRLWDTYVAEAGGTRFSDFLAYACATFLLHWVDLLKGMEFQDIIMFLQKVPTGHWTEKEVELILSQAFMYQNKFGKSKLVT